MSDKVALFAFTEAKLFAYKLPFKAPMQFKQYQLHHREGLILQLTDKKGAKYFTDIAPLPGFSLENFEQVKTEMIQLFSEICLTKQLNLKQHFSSCHSIQFALDALFLSLSVKKSDAHVDMNIEMDGEVNIDNVALLQGSSTAIASQYQTLGKPNLIKLKVARESIDIDISNFQQLCQSNTALKIRCDANQAWSEQQATQFFSGINIKQLDYIEEPTSNHQVNLQLADKFNINLGLDETLLQPDFIYQHHHSISAFIIKPTLIGAKHKIDKLMVIAKQLGIKVSFSACFESAVGIQKLKLLATSYLVAPQDRAFPLSLGIDTLKYFDGALLQDSNNIEQDCQQLELLCTSNK